MPLMSGEETFEKLRTMRPDLPVSMSSGYNQVEVIRRFAGRVHATISTCQVSGSVQWAAVNPARSGRKQR